MEKDFDLYAEQTALFDAYLRAEMTSGQRTEFETRLAENESFRRDFDLHRALLDSLQRNKEREDWRQRLLEARQPTPSAKKSALARWWPLALLLVVVGGLYWFWAHSGTGNERTNSKPTGPVASGDQNQTMPYGAGHLVKTTRVLPVRHVVVQTGKKTATAILPNVVLEVFLTRETKPAGNVQNGRVQVYLPENQIREESDYHLIRLTKDGTSTAFLQIGTAFYRLPEADNFLEKVTDENVLQWLR